MGQDERNRDHIAVLLTCYNRKEKTISCISSLSAAGGKYPLEFIVTDDESSDGTREALEQLSCKIKLLRGTGRLFWNGGMNSSMEYVLANPEAYGYVMLVNDDVVFEPDAVSRLMNRLETCGADIVVGSTRDSGGNMSYGGVRMLSGHFARYQKIEPSEEPAECDTFNCNCVLMGIDTFCKLGKLDPVYVHSMSDYDYGMRAHRKGLRIVNCDAHIGICDDNQTEGTWRDPALPRKKRLALKESPKGLPKHDWFYFIKKNYGFLPACYHSITPYIRIMIKK